VRKSDLLAELTDVMSDGVAKDLWKKNNWKTEETLARTVVTVETERIKESNP